MKLPIGIQTFSEIRERGYLYIDKTKHIHTALSAGKYFFLSRPRRFGKSLLLSTIQSLYEGRKDLFEGLWIKDHRDWEKQHPVIHIQFSQSDYQGKGLDMAIVEELQRNAKRLNITLEKDTVKSSFVELIKKASEQNKVVILIDEYDKPIIDYLEDIPQVNANRQILKNFYSVLKDSDPYLELVFITGVSRFAKTSIFSDLNNLKNLTMHPAASDLLGITQEELQHYFYEGVNQIASKAGVTPDVQLERIRHWYNGYSWDGETRVYNPFSLLSYFDAKRFKNYWFETGTPTFLIHIMRKERDFDITDITASEEALDDYDLEHLNAITVLFQTGYLTIKKQIYGGLYQLGYPNHEVRVSLEERLLNAYMYDKKERGRVHAYHIAEALKAGDIEKAIEIINSVFSTIPYNLWKEENEAFYHALVHLTFSLMGVFIQSEVKSSKGRLDAKVETEDTIYILEFKLDKSAAEALQQIEDKKYFQAYLNSDKKRIGIGINFSKEKKETEEYELRAF